MSKDKKDDAPATITDTTTTSADTAISQTTTNTDTTFKDGTYTIDDSYQSPGGNEPIKTSITIKDGIVTDTSVKQDPNNDESAQHQADFATEFKSKVIGKAISGLSISRISGASLTTDAFNDALDQIRTKAQA